MEQLNWNKWIKDGDQFLRAATPKKEKSAFGPQILYNLLSMSLEGYIMAILDYHHTLPDNHTYSDLIYALEMVMPVDEKLKERILKYENIQSICEIEQFHVEAPSEEQLLDLKGAVKEVSDIAHKVCSK